MMCWATSGVIFNVPLARVLGPGLEMVPEEEEITSVSVQFFVTLLG